jgi:hypothetical protein
MKRTIGIFVVAVMVVFGTFQLRQQRVHADTPSTIPSAYGRCVGYVHVKGSDGLIFQADDGTIRLLNLDTGGIVTFSRN